MTQAPASQPPLATCIGCGCDDLHACADLFGDPCYWLTVDRAAGTGVCSQCRECLPAEPVQRPMIPRTDAGDPRAFEQGMTALGA